MQAKVEKIVCKVGTMLSGCMLGCDPKTGLMKTTSLWFLVTVSPSIGLLVGLNPVG